jgi:hypothetical protein
VLAAAGVVVSTLIEAFTPKSWESAEVEAFGSERNPSFTSHVQVSQGIEIVAVFPLIDRGTGALPGPSQ